MGLFAVFLALQPTTTSYRLAPWQLENHINIEVKLVMLTHYSIVTEGQTESNALAQVGSKMN